MSVENDDKTIAVVVLIVFVFILNSLIGIYIRYELYINIRNTIIPLMMYLVFSLNLFIKSP